jgi:hypothetical protein
MSTDFVEVTSEVTYDDLPPLNVEKVRLAGEYDPCVEKITGRRLVNIQHIITNIRRLENHMCRISKTGYLSFEKEQTIGLHSKLFFSCKECGFSTSFETNPTSNDNSNKSDDNVNYLVTSSIIAIGKSYSAIEELLSNLDIPGFSLYTFAKYQRKVGHSWNEVLTKSIEEAGRLEYANAANNNMVGDIGKISVIVDGGWSHRSYGHRYTAKSGVAIIIGVHTKKILFMGVRNKYCSICAMAMRKGTTIPTHVCFKNWEGASTGMEADILQEGFSCSEAMHKLRYVSFVGDGDSSVHSKILESVPYSRSIKKIECANHVTKNLTKHLFNLAKESNANKSLLTTAEIGLIGKTVRKVISWHASQNDSSPTILKNDILNVTNYAFCDHSRCNKFYCLKVGTVGISACYKNCSTQVKIRLSQIIGGVTAKCESLILNATSNRAEMFMHQVAKNGAKAIFYGRRNGLNIRCQGGSVWTRVVFKSL